MLLRDPPQNFLKFWLKAFETLIAIPLSVGSLGGTPQTHPPTRLIPSFFLISSSYIQACGGAAGYKGKSNWCTTTKAQPDEQAALLQVRGVAHNYFVPGEHM